MVRELTGFTGVLDFARIDDNEASEFIRHISQRLRHLNRVGLLETRTAAPPTDHPSAHGPMQVRTTRAGMDAFIASDPRPKRIAITPAGERALETADLAGEVCAAPGINRAGPEDEKGTARLATAIDRRKEVVLDAEADAFQMEADEARRRGMSAPSGELPLVRLGPGGDYRRDVCGQDVLGKHLDARA